MPVRWLILATALATSGISRAEELRSVDIPSSLPKQYRMIVGMPPGGGVDAYARLVQRNLPRFLTLNAPVVVQNMPGAGSLRSVIAVANSALDPEVSIGTFSSSLLTEAITHPERVKIDFRDFAFLNNMAEDSRLCFVTSRSGIGSLVELKSGRVLTFGATAPGTSGNLDTAILQKMFGVRLNLVLGYAGSAEKRLALERGEIDGDCAGTTSLPDDWLRDGKVRVLVRFSASSGVGIVGAAPFGGDLLSDPDQRRVYDFLVTPQQLGRLFMVSRKIPASTVSALRAAFDLMVVQPGFLQEARSLGLPITATRGFDVDRRIDSMYETSKDLVARARIISGD